jgi:anti-anti-sigma factor
VHTDEQFAVAVSLAPDRARVCCRGELDLATVPTLRTCVDDLLIGSTEHRSLILLDLSELTFCDSTGIKTLLDLADRCRCVGAILRITNVPPKIGRVFDLTGTTRLLNIEIRDGNGRPLP